MVVDIGLLFTAIDVTKSLAEYLELVESLGSKIDRIMNSEFDAAQRELEQASRSIDEAPNLLRSARSKFNRAASLERGQRLALTYVGLALCHHHLQDEANTRAALQDLLAVKCETMASDRLRAVAKDLGIKGLVLPVVFGLVAAAKLSNNEPIGPATQSMLLEKEHVEGLQRAALMYLEAN
jgi:hypothetical protein